MNLKKQIEWLERNQDKIAVVLGLIAVLILVRGCPADKITTNDEADRLKVLVLDLIAQRDSAKARVDTIEIERTKVLTRWKIQRHDSLIPCEEKLLVCDTIIKIDSTEIQGLKKVVALSDNIIKNQGLVILSQDETITDLTKTVKKERRKKRLWQVLTALSLGAAIAR